MSPDKYYLVVRYVHIGTTCYVYQEIYVSTTESEEDVVNLYVALGQNTRLILVREIIDLNYDIHIECFGDDPYVGCLPHNFTRTVTLVPKRTADYVLTSYAIKSIKLIRRREKQ